MFFFTNGFMMIVFFISAVVSPTRQLKTDVTNCECLSTLGVLKYYTKRAPISSLDLTAT